jgi:hypothetical protein
VVDLPFFELREAQFEIQLEFEVGVIPVAADIAERNFTPGFADLGNQVQPPFTSLAKRSVSRKATSAVPLR